ncbi:MAG: transposase [Rhodothermales bacterium]|nr:transposase [Rhodothermales bacterium]
MAHRPPDDSMNRFPERFQGRYRIPSARLAGRDYGEIGGYFVTINTKNGQPYFGRLVRGRVMLSLLGQAAWDCWATIPEYFPNVIADTFVAMPNHVHGIIWIKEHRSPEAGPNRFGPQSLNLGSIMRGYKSGVTMYARRRGLEFGWHPRFYDRIIRDAIAYERIRRYILDNPEKGGRGK